MSSNPSDHDEMISPNDTGDDRLYEWLVLMGGTSDPAVTPDTLVSLHEASIADEAATADEATTIKHETHSSQPQQTELPSSPDNSLTEVRKIKSSMANGNYSSG